MKWAIVERPTGLTEASSPLVAAALVVLLVVTVADTDTDSVVTVEAVVVVVVVVASIVVVVSVVDTVFEPGLTAWAVIFRGPFLVGVAPTEGGWFTLNRRPLLGVLMDELRNSDDAKRVAAS